MGEFRNNTASIGTITKKPGFSRPIMRLLAQKIFFLLTFFLFDDESQIFVEITLI